MRLSRRSFLIASAGASLSPALVSAQAADWRARVPVVRLGVSSSENEGAAAERHDRVVAYLSRRLGVPVRINRSTDYAGLVEAMRADQIEFARFGPAVYALGRRVLGDKLQPLFRDIDNNGQEGYFSVVVVRADSAFGSIADLRGRTFAFADPNSTSGFAFPSFYLRQQGFEPRTHFGATTFSGSHDNSVIALVRGQFDAIATFQVNENSGVVQRLQERGVVPRGSSRVIWTSPLIPASPMTARNNIPPELRDQFVAAMMAMRTEDPEAWRVFTDGQVSGYAPARHEDYLDVITVIEELDRNRRRT
jgi:phosphonate transport system substrate-binding protein